MNLLAYLPSLRQLRKGASLLACFIIFGVVCELIYLQKNACSETDSMRQIQLLCYQYHNKEVVGNMCPSLCDHSVFHLKQCHGNALGKKVIILGCEGCIEPGKSSTVVLKVEYDVESWHQALSRNISAVQSLQEKIKLAEEDIKAHSMEFYDTDMSGHEDILSHILGEKTDDAIARMGIPNARDVVLRTSMGLGSQEEFLSYKILGAKPYLPTLHGVCGPAYFVEYTPSFSSLNYIYFSAKKPDILSMKIQGPPWSARATAALSILRMIPDIEDSYRDVLHVCDVQPHNFGLSEKGEAVMLDSDSLKFGHVLRTGPCAIDKDCNFITCKGLCNQTTHVCEKEMYSNNLQVVCSKLFLTAHPVFGLLRGAPKAISDRLRQVLDRCSNPELAIRKIARENKSDRQIIRELEVLLKSTL